MVSIVASEISLVSSEEIMICVEPRQAVCFGQYEFPAVYKSKLLNNNVHKKSPNLAVWSMKSCPYYCYFVYLLSHRNLGDAKV